MVEINKRYTDASTFYANVHRFGYVCEFSGALIMKKMNAIAHADREIWLAVVIKIADRASQAARSSGQARPASLVLKFPIA